MDNLIIACILTASIIIVLLKTGHFRKIIRYQAQLDILVTVAIGILFAPTGSLNAFIIAIFGGFVFSVVISIVYRLVPHERLVRMVDTDGTVRRHWATFPPPGLFNG